jgi:hypothetical protein
MNGERIPLRVAHYGRRDPAGALGGVEAFARRLSQVFAQVELVWPGAPGLAALVRDRTPIVCDNDTALDWPPDVPLVAFQHGVAWQKVRVTRAWTDARLAVRQLRAARRPRTVWVACARWIAHAFAPLHRQAPQHVIPHFVDAARFDGALENAGSRLVLHDARTRAKGSRLVARLREALPRWRFEALACPPDTVADRMRKAAAFVHLSRYEGNSIVCTEAMAMGLPCIFTDVGWSRDAALGGAPLPVALLETRRAFGDPTYLIERVAAHLDRARVQPWSARAFVLEHAGVEAARAGWRRAMRDLARLDGRVLLGDQPWQHTSERG